MRDPYTQREDERALEDEEYARRTEIERAERRTEHAPDETPPRCSACGSRAGVYDVGGGPACAWCGAPVSP